MKDSGISENEAIGTVLSEFGNMDEIIEEYDLPLEEESDVESKDETYLDDEEAEKYLQHRHKFAFSIALGVFFCVIAVALFFAVETFFEYLLLSVSKNISDVAATITLLFTVTIGVSLFTIFRIKESTYSFENKILRLDAKTYTRLKVEHDEFQTAFCLCGGYGRCPLYFGSY